MTTGLVPLRRSDPPSLGGVVLTGRLSEDDSAVLFAGQCAGDPVVVVMLTDGANGDPYARARFAEAIATRRDADTHSVVETDDDPEFAAWVAVRADSYTAGLTSAQAVVSAVTVADRPPVGTTRGPEFRPHWFRRRGLGRWRLWPLPWPRTWNRAGLWTFLASFALVLAIALSALLIAIKVLPPPPPPTGPTPTVTNPLVSPPTNAPSPSTGPPTTGPGSTEPPATGPGGPPID